MSLALVPSGTPERFQTLIGTVKSNDTRYTLIHDAIVFQTLIGTVKRRRPWT